MMAEAAKQSGDAAAAAVTAKANEANPEANAKTLYNRASPPTTRGR
jgi:hypothetical protein